MRPNWSLARENTLQMRLAFVAICLLWPEAKLPERKILETLGLTYDGGRSTGLFSVWFKLNPCIVGITACTEFLENTLMIWMNVPENQRVSKYMKSHHNTWLSYRRRNWRFVSFETDSYTQSWARQSLLKESLGKEYLLDWIKQTAHCCAEFVELSVRNYRQCVITSEMAKRFWLFHFLHHSFYMSDSKIWLIWN